MFARMVPEIECHTHETAEAIAASAEVGKNLPQRPVAKPAF